MVLDFGAPKTSSSASLLSLPISSSASSLGSLDPNAVRDTAAGNRIRRFVRSMDSSGFCDMAFRPKTDFGRDWSSCDPSGPRKTGQRDPMLN